MTSHTRSFAPEIIGQQSPSALGGCTLPAHLPQAGNLLAPWQPALLSVPCLYGASVPALPGKGTGEPLEGHCHHLANSQRYVQEWKWMRAVATHSRG